MISLGLDIGSRFAKAAILDGDELRHAVVVEVVAATADEVAALASRALAEAGLARRDLALVVATGASAEQSREAALLADEATCVAAAAAYFAPDAELVLHVGAQSSLALRLDAEGELCDYARNDRCAAGTGRLAELICGRLDVPLAELDARVAAAKRPTSVSAQCAVFAESEVIAQINEGATVPDVLAGVSAAIARIAAAQAARFAEARSYALTGGVGRFAGVAARLAERVTARRVPFPFDPQLAGAIGAALLEPDEG